MNKFWIYGLVFVAVIAIFVILGSCSKTTKVEIVNSPNVQTTSIKKPVVKVFLENSGSMDGFMCEGSELKDGIYNFLTNVKDNSSKMELYYINSEIMKQDVPLSQYIRNLNPISFKKAGGNRAFTDVPNLFTKVLETVNENTIAIYISDCILDMPNHAAPNYLYITRTDIHSAFGDKIDTLNNLAVCVYQLESTFNGTYFFPKGGSKSYMGKLPYYMFLIGSNTQLANLRNNVSDEDITHGVMNYCAFTPYFDAPAALSQGNKALKTIELNTQKNGRYHFNVETNLDQSLQSDKILTNQQNYVLTSPKNIKIESISPITIHNSKYSHIIEFSIIDAAFGNVVTLNRIPMPSWIKDSNDIQGSYIYPNKTFGIEFIIGGISDAYNNKSTSSFKLNIKKQ